MIGQYSDNKITEMWMCALNYGGCIITFKNGKKQAIGTDMIKQILLGYRAWLDGQYTSEPINGLRIDDRLTKYFDTIGIVEMQFI